MAQVSSWSQLEAQLQKVAEQALQESATKAVDLAKEKVDSVVYSNSSPSWYQRTYDLRNSIRDNPMETSGKTSMVKIDHNDALIFADNIGFQHYSPTWGSSVSYVTKIVHDGLSGSMFGSNHAGLRPRPYMEDAKNELRAGKFRQFMMDEITGMGFSTR